MAEPVSPSRMRTPLSRAIGLGSAKEGVDHWWAERITALIQQMYDQRSSGITIKERLPPARLC